MKIQQSLKPMQTNRLRNLTLISVFLSFIWLFIPNLVVNYELVTQSGITTPPKVDFLLFYKGIESFSGCSLAKIEWSSNVYERINWAYLNLGFGFLYLPILLWAPQYLRKYRPSLLRYFFLLCTLFLLPIFLAFFFLDSDSSVFCQQIPVVKVNYVYPFVPSAIVLILNLFLATVIDKIMRLEESEKDTEFLHQVNNS